MGPILIYPLLLSIVIGVIVFISILKILDIIDYTLTLYEFVISMESRRKSLTIILKRLHNFIKYHQKIIKIIVIIVSFIFYLLLFILLIYTILRGIGITTNTEAFGDGIQLGIIALYGLLFYYMGKIIKQTYDLYKRLKHYYMQLSLGEIIIRISKINAKLVIYDLYSLAIMIGAAMISGMTSKLFLDKINNPTAKVLVCVIIAVIIAFQKAVEDYIK